MSETAVDRLRENAVQVTSLLVTALWMAGLFTNQDWWLAALIVGYVAVVPLAEVVFGTNDNEESEWSDWSGEADQETSSETSHTDESDPLETLRERYARGELTDEQFERKLERLLETETVEDAEAFHASSPRSQAREDVEDRRAIDRELERER
jgi:uncharacterized membrane protein